MKKLLAILAFVPSAYAAPFLTADVDPTTAECGVTVGALPKVFIPAQTVAITVATPTGRICKHDLGALGLAAGTYSLTMTARSAGDPAWGTLETAPSAAISTTKPAAVAVPQNPKLSPV